MANSYDAFFQTLTAALADPNKALVAPNNLINCVYKDFKPEPVQPYSVLQIPIPSSSATVSDIGSGGITFQDVAASTVNLTFNKHPAIGFKLPDWDLVRAAGDIRALFLDEAVKRMLENLNGAIGALITSTNFSGVVSGSSAGTTPFTDVTSAWATLVTNKVNVRDEGNLFYITYPTIYQSLLGDTNWTAYNQIGDGAGNVRRTARMAMTLGAIMDYDLDIPAPSTGVYDNFLFHRYALALAIRPLPTIDKPGAQSQTFYAGDIPYRVTVSFDHDLMADKVSVDMGYAVGPLRGTHGIRVRNAA